MSLDLPPALVFGFYTLIAWGLSGTFVAFRMLADDNVKAGIWMRVGVLGWLGLPAVLAVRGVFLDTTGTPPNLMLMILPMALTVIAFSVSPWGLRVAKQLPLTFLVGIQGFRLPLELVLYGLGTHGLLPKEMTFAGYNFDVVTGASALVLWYVLHKHTASRAVLAGWNVLGLALLIAIVTIAILSFPAPFGWFQPPNLLVAFYPWVWLPTFLVQLALLSHLLMIRKLMLPEPPPGKNI